MKTIYTQQEAAEIFDSKKSFSVETDYFPCIDILKILIELFHEKLMDDFPYSDKTRFKINLDVCAYKQEI
jgi:hypothetical protein